MAPIQQVLQALQSAATRAQFRRLYGDKPGVFAWQVERYTHAIERFQALFPGQREIELFSAPGRTELGGNHTDHNGGRVLAAAVDLDIVAVVARNHEHLIRIHSQGYAHDTLALDQLAPVAGEQYTPAALARGVCGRLQALGHTIGGFDAYATSTVPEGSGLSSSAAYEVLVAVIENELYNAGRLDPLLLAQVAQYAENHYFNKPCGLMDQTTCAVGGLVTIDFEDFAHPIVQHVAALERDDFAGSGFALVIVNTGGNHADLTGDYTALEHEMKAVARALGGQVLRQFSAQQVLQNLAGLRRQVNDRAILRALHFYADDQRVVEQVAALERDDFAAFLRLVIESGYSSWMWCQNVYAHHNIAQQGLSIGLAVSQELLAGAGAWRVHGGGFAGTLQAFVPDGLLEAYVAQLEAVFGAGACHRLVIRPQGAVRLAGWGMQ